MDLDADADAQAMASAMGFASFGAQDRPQKKRKYNPNADAAGLVSQATPPKQATTGSNSTPLGTSTRAAPPPQALSNTDEISLEEDGEAEGGVSLGTEGSEATGAEQGTKAESQLHWQQHGLPQRPPAQFQQPAHNSSRFHGHAGGQAPWYDGYYDPSSNENPWRRLEDSLGLQSKGSWLSRDAQAVPNR
ncbi:hypothetical protein HJFPF1_06603 [Paramyrothecium foliicola]|nr:hypothetical protein HJFPF1_06603 [Paramyrothecium foliicola]